MIGWCIKSWHESNISSSYKQWQSRGFLHIVYIRNNGNKGNLTLSSQNQLCYVQLWDWLSEMWTQDLKPASIEKQQSHRYAVFANTFLIVTHTERNSSCVGSHVHSFKEQELLEVLKVTSLALKTISPLCKVVCTIGKDIMWLIRDKIVRPDLFHGCQSTATEQSGGVSSRSKRHFVCMCEGEDLLFSFSECLCKFNTEYCGNWIIVNYVMTFFLLL